MTAETKSNEHHDFQAEVSRLLHLMVHAVYTDKEIFLRELISNASDACDKLRYEAIAAPNLLEGDADFTIKITPNKTAGTLTVSDNGIGMSREELVENLGTIARSGTRAFLERLQEQPEGNALIGQFGVGFYAAFMVADRIEVVSRRAGTEGAWMWVSDGTTGFDIKEAPADRANLVSHGTSVTLVLKKDAEEFLDPVSIERIVRTYSDHILFPVELIGENGEARQVNSASALWQRSKSEVKPEDYEEVYRTVSGHFDKPAHTIHYKAEGRQEYAVLLFIPEQRPFDLYDADRKGRVKLYVRRVFITDDAGLLPTYMRFIRGVVDSEDVPLNISREMLQNNPMVAQIRKALTGRVLSELETLSEKKPDAYDAIWEAFGAVVKEGLYEDFERREQLLKLSRFRTTAGTDNRSLAQVAEALRPNQNEIYYLVGDSIDRLEASPQLEAATARGVEVLLLTDPIDAFWTTQGLSFDEKPLRSLTQGDVDLSAIPLLDETIEKPADQADAAGLLEKLKIVLGDTVSEVRASQRLVKSPVCLIAPGSGPDLELEKLLSRQDSGVGLKPILEVNTGHALVTAIAKELETADTETSESLAGLLFDQAHILDGQPPADPALYTERINALLIKALTSSDHA